jgi:hypothetical protein
MGGYVAVSPVVTDGTLFVSSRDNTLTAFRPS